MGNAFKQMEAFSCQEPNASIIILDGMNIGIHIMFYVWVIVTIVKNISETISKLVVGLGQIKNH